MRDQVPFPFQKTHKISVFLNVFMFLEMSWEDKRFWAVKYLTRILYWKTSLWQATESGFQMSHTRFLKYSLLTWIMVANMKANDMGKKKI